MRICLRQKRTLRRNLALLTHLAQDRRRGESMEHGYGTHAITNQTPPLRDYNLFSTDQALQEAVQREGAGWAVLNCCRPAMPSARTRCFEHARLANRFTPVLHNYNVQGERIDCDRVSPLLACIDAGHRGAGLSQRPLGRARMAGSPRRACGARRGLSSCRRRSSAARSARPP